jgi:hypothetical protein
MRPQVGPVPPQPVKSVAAQKVVPLKKAIPGQGTAPRPRPRAKTC